MTGPYESIERKRSVFISSSFRDLSQQRRALIDGTLKAEQIPVAMEFFTGDFRHTLSHIKPRIEQADIFVTMVGSSLGSYASPSEIHYVELELNIAEKRKLPIIPVLLDDREHEDASREYKNSPHFDEKAASQLEALRTRLRKTADGEDRLVLFFTKDTGSASLETLRDSFALRLINTVTSLAQSGGWVPGRYVQQAGVRLERAESANRQLGEALAKRALNEEIGENVFFSRFVARMNDFSILAGRLNLRRDLKRGVADYFWSQYLTPIVQREFRYVYFESGSSIAYACRNFIERLSERNSDKDMAFSRYVRIWTNNFVALFDLLLHPHWRWQDVQVYPFGDFFDKYGATYGRILRGALEKNLPGIEEMRPDVDILGQDARTAVDKVARQLEAHFTSKSIILFTASGIDRRRLMTKEDGPYEAKADGNLPDFTPFPGPHTGSYYNMLIKRALLQQSCPKVLFLDDYKWNLPFIFDNCFPVCDSTFSWHDLIGRTPLAIAVSTDSRDKRDQIHRELNEMGFVRARLGTPPDKSMEPGETLPWSVIAANEKFHEQLPV